MKPDKFSRYTLYLLLLICTVTAGFYFGGAKVASEIHALVPVYTGLLIWVVVGLLSIALAAVIFFVIIRFAERYRRSPKEAVRSVLGLFILAFLMFFCWLCSNGNLLSLPGYKGLYNTQVWIKITDMLIYSTYVLIGAAVLLIIGFFIARKVR